MAKGLLKNSSGSVDMQAIGLVAGVLITIIVSVLIFYSIAGSIASDFTTLDSDVETARGGNTTSGTPVTNSTNAVLDQAATVYTILPIIAIVIVAAIILIYVSRVGG